MTGVAGGKVADGALPIVAPKGRQKLRKEFECLFSLDVSRLTVRNYGCLENPSFTYEELSRNTDSRVLARP